MATGNAINANTAGIVGYDGSSVFTGTSMTQHAVLVGGSSTSTITNLGVGTNGQVLIAATTADPAFATITGTGGITFTTGANSLVINGTGGGLSWSDNSGTFTASSSNGYFITAASTPTLPASPSEGDVVAFILDAAATLTITGNTGQKIRLGSTLSASAGTCVSSTRGNAIYLVYRSTGTTWFGLNSVGTWTIT